MKFYLFALFLISLLLIGCSGDEAKPLASVDSITPDYGRAGDTVTVHGKNFGNVPSAISAKFFNGKKATVISVNDTTLTVIAPFESASGTVEVAIDGQTLTTSNFTFHALYMFGAKSEGRYLATTWKDSVETKYANTHSNIVEAVVYNGDVYAIGYHTPVLGLKPPPAYWKNGVMIDIPGVDENSRFTGITVSDGDVYIVGMENYIATYVGNTAYWKNGEKVVLPDGGGSSKGAAMDIAVYGSDVYVAGQSVNGDYISACYWKNGELNFLSETTDIANAITIVGSDIYIAGTRTTATESLAVMWKNDEITFLNDDQAGAYYGAESVFVSGSEVYVGGYLNDRRNSPFKYQGKYWKNGVENTIEVKQGNNSQASVQCISKYRDDIFMTLASGSNSGIYKNNKPIFLSKDNREVLTRHAVVEY